MGLTPVPSFFKFQTLPGVILHFYSKRQVPPRSLLRFKPFQGLFCISTVNAYIEHSLWAEFQTLPGVILHFYSNFQTPHPLSHLFQTLPGVILHFYVFDGQHESREGNVSNPSRGYSAFLQELDAALRKREQQFQTLPGVILHFYAGWRCFCRRRNGSFKPFQGLFCISTRARRSCNSIGFVSNPSRGYSAFLRPLKADCPDRGCRVSNPSRGYSAFLRGKYTQGDLEMVVSNPSRGYSAFLRWSASYDWNVRNLVSNPSRGYSAFLHTQDFLHQSKHSHVSNPSRGYSAFLR